MISASVMRLSLEISDFVDIDLMNFSVATVMRLSLEISEFVVIDLLNSVVRGTELLLAEAELFDNIFLTSVIELDLSSPADFALRPLSTDNAATSCANAACLLLLLL